MKVGTIETLDDIAKSGRVLRPGLTGGLPPANGGGGRNPGGGSDRSDDSDHVNTGSPTAKSRILTAFLLLVVAMTFGGLAAAYLVISTNKAAEWRPFDLPIQVWISTAIILASSLTFHFGKLAVDRDNLAAARKWLVATTVLGAAFISSQFLAWIELVGRGLYLAGNPYAGFFYILTALHALHVLGGIIALGSVLLHVWYPSAAAEKVERRASLAQVVSWYWHFMGAIWIALFVMLGFWR